MERLSVEAILEGVFLPLCPHTSATTIVTTSKDSHAVIQCPWKRCSLPRLKEPERQLIATWEFMQNEGHVWARAVPARSVKPRQLMSAVSSIDAGVT